MSVLFGRSAGFDRLVLVFGGFRVFAVFTYLLEVSGVRSFRFLLGGVQEYFPFAMNSRGARLSGVRWVWLSWHGWCGCCGDYGNVRNYGAT